MPASPCLGPRKAPLAHALNDDAVRPVKRLRKTMTDVETASNLEELLRATLPDKECFFKEWLAALASPAVCITSLEDVKRLGTEDIAGLPVPPLVKGVLRQVLVQEAERAAEQQAVLEATAARARAFLAPLRDRNMQPPLAGSKYFQDAKNYRLIVTREEIEAGVRIVAHRIETWCKGERVVLVGILKGAFMFLSDLCRALTRPYSVYFVEASSYQDARSQGGLQIASNMSSAKFSDATTKKPHKIVLVDELLDNGKTMHDMKQHFLQNLASTHSEQDILTVCLFSKERAREHPEADITGIPGLPDLWLVGYGLDDRGTKRGWTELFAVPKVKIVSTIRKEDVDKLLAHMDEGAMITEPHIFAGFELTCNRKQKYRVKGVDVQAQHARDRGTLTVEVPEANITCRADVERVVAGLATVKGKFEHEVHFAFIPENLTVVAEDAIFYGNAPLYADMRCRLRKRIAAAARRCGVQGPGGVVAA